MKDFKFLKNAPERSLFSHFQGVLDEDEYSYRTRMLQRPGDVELLMMMKRFIVECIRRNNPMPDMELPWGVIHVRGAHTFPDNQHRTCARGSCIVLVVGEPAVTYALYLSSEEYQFFTELIDSE